MFSNKHQLIVFSFEPQDNERQAELFEMIENLPFDKTIFYSKMVNEDDFWEQAGYEQNLQKGQDEGERMMHALRLGFKRRYEKIVLIQQSCESIRFEIIEEAFNTLDQVDVVIGPSKNAGYYLIGMCTLEPKIFQNKEWNTENVLLDTLIDLKKLNYSFKILRTL